MTAASEFPYGGGVFFFSGLGKDQVISLIHKDPYFENGLVDGFDINEIDDLGK